MHGSPESRIKKFNLFIEGEITMSLKNKIIVEPEREVRVGAVVFDLTMLFGCNTSTPKPPVQLEGMVTANYWLSKGENQPPLYQISCRGVPQEGQKYPEKAYYFEVSTFQQEPFSEELEARIIDKIKKTPAN